MQSKAEVFFVVLAVLCANLCFLIGVLYSEVRKALPRCRYPANLASRYRLILCFAAERSARAGRRAREAKHKFVRYNFHNL